MREEREKISLTQKLEIIKLIERKAKVGDVALEFNLSPSTISTIIKNRDLILKSSIKFNKNSSRLRLSSRNSVEDALSRGFAR
jgi:hypothetical protein